MLWQTVAAGAPAQQVQVVYSQAFEPVPDQWEAPVAGTVGLGTIKGEVGVVKTVDKRAEATAVAVAERVMLRRDADADAEAFVILPPGGGGGDARVEKRQMGENAPAPAPGHSQEGLGDDSSGAAKAVMLNAGPPTLALLIAMLAAVVM